MQSSITVSVTNMSVENRPRPNFPQEFIQIVLVFLNWEPPILKTYYWLFMLPGQLQLEVLLPKTVFMKYQ